MNEFCLRKGGYFNTGKTEKILIKVEDKNFINASQVATAEFSKKQYLQWVCWSTLIHHINKYFQYFWVINTKYILNFYVYIYMT